MKRVPLAVLDDFNPRSPHGERRDCHPERVPHFAFQPTLPARGATCIAPTFGQPPFISTHAPRTGSDKNERRPQPRHPDFNPRSPHGERQKSSKAQTRCWTFQPTLPARGATKALPELRKQVRDFNPRSPHGERRQRGIMRLVKQDFNPRSPHGERHQALADLPVTIEISTHAPRTGSDVWG